MRVLRLGTSNDDAGGVPVEARAWKVAERLLAESAGEPVETVLKRAWPNAAFPALVRQWLDEYQPEMVVLQVNNFWYGYESTPLWFERRFGRTGVRLSRLGLRVGKSPRFADNRWAQFLNRRLLAVLPGATYFTVPQVAETVEAAMRGILAREGVVLLVRGNENWTTFPMASRRFNRRNAERNAAMSAAMRGVCARLRVPYAERAALDRDELKPTLTAAGWHNSAEGERLTGEFDGQAMADAWKVAQPHG
ncbi:MAG: hypothetical protein HY875_08515 [Chloroflexi bacterium]|nr:hypothetical protein [Chloroflexota bacterium]